MKTGQIPNKLFKAWMEYIGIPAMKKAGLYPGQQNNIA